MSKHTPGPWREYDDGDTLWVEATPHRSAVICDVVGNLWDNKEQVAQITPEDIANARLIAAAPDLLRLLKLALEDIGADEHCCKAAPDSWHPHAISLIRSIEGGAQ